jgi:hypothetical protein
VIGANVKKPCANISVYLSGGSMVYCSGSVLGFSAATHMVWCSNPGAHVPKKKEVVCMKSTENHIFCHLNYNLAFMIITVDKGYHHMT